MRDIQVTLTTDWYLSRLADTTGYEHYDIRIFSTDTQSMVFTVTRSELKYILRLINEVLRDS